MVRSLSLVAAAALTSVATAALGAPAAGLGITMKVPASGSAGAITGTVTGGANAVYNQFKVSVLTSGDNGATWWDKSHGPYRNHQLADPSYNPAQAQNAGVVITSAWTWTLQGYQASPNDATSDLWIAFLVPQSYSMAYPGYQIEGVAIRGDLEAASIAWTLVSKTRGTLASGTGPFTGVPTGGVPALPSVPAVLPSVPAVLPSVPAVLPSVPALPGTSPAASPAAGAPAASPAASPAAGAPAASPAAAASPDAAAPSTAALPASSGAPAATTGATTGDTGAVTSGAAPVFVSALTAAAAVAMAVVMA